MALMYRYRTEPQGRGGYRIAGQPPACVVDSRALVRSLCGRQFRDRGEPYTLRPLSDPVAGVSLCEACQRRLEATQQAERNRLEAWNRGAARPAGGEDQVEGQPAAQH